MGEYLLGNVSIVEIRALPILALLYGSGALLIREVARRTGRRGGPRGVVPVRLARRDLDRVAFGVVVVTAIRTTLRAGGR
ncbi:MAG TPA: hypothetical protein VGF55_09155 [Gemmataceae bacterium]